MISYKYVIANKGIGTEDDYPYDIMGYDKYVQKSTYRHDFNYRDAFLQSACACRKPPPVHACNMSKASHHNVTISSFVQVTANSEPQLAAAIAKTPVTVAVSANSLWQHYKGGIMPPNWCPSPVNPKSLNHMILAVGIAPGYYIVVSLSICTRPHVFVRFSLTETTCLCRRTPGEASFSLSPALNSACARGTFVCNSRTKSRVSDGLRVVMQEGGASRGT